MNFKTESNVSLIKLIKLHLCYKTKSTVNSVTLMTLHSYLLIVKLNPMLT